MKTKFSTLAYTVSDEAYKMLKNELKDDNDKPVLIPMFIARRIAEIVDEQMATMKKVDRRKSQSQKT